MEVKVLPSQCEARFELSSTVYKAECIGYSPVSRHEATLVKFLLLTFDEQFSPASSLCANLHFKTSA